MLLRAEKMDSNISSDQIYNILAVELQQIRFSGEVIYKSDTKAHISDLYKLPIIMYAVPKDIANTNVFFKPNVR